MKTYKSEPERCAGCGEAEMNYIRAEVDGTSALGWICDACGHFHAQSEIPGFLRIGLDPDTHRCIITGTTIAQFKRGLWSVQPLGWEPFMVRSKEKAISAAKSGHLSLLQRHARSVRVPRRR